MAYEYYRITAVPPRLRIEYCHETIPALKRRISAQRGANRRGRADIKAGRKGENHADWIKYKTRRIEFFKRKITALENYLAGKCSWDVMVKRLGLMKCAQCGAENRAYIWTGDFITTGYYCLDCHARATAQLKAWEEKHGRAAERVEQIETLAAAGIHGTGGRP